MTKLASIKTALNQSGDGRAIDLLLAMEKKASKCNIYAIAFDLWLKKGSTSLLRDTLCEPFKNFSFIDKSTHLDFFNMWAAIDSAHNQRV
jgi:hypothetical protein